MADYKQYDEIFNKASQTYGVDKSLLLGIAKTESNFDAKATSKYGAKGIMQLMDATAKELGVTNSYDAEQNIMGGAKYISQLLDKYDGDTDKALASYFGGSGNVDKYGAEKYSYYYKKVYKNQAEFTGVSTGSVSSDALINTGLGLDDDNKLIPVVNIIFVILIAIIGVVFVALSIGSATGTTGKVTKAIKTYNKVKKGDIEGATKEVVEVAAKGVKDGVSEVIE